jgi:hypothetical protein
LITPATGNIVVKSAAESSRLRKSPRVAEKSGSALPVGGEKLAELERSG